MANSQSSRLAHLRALAQSHLSEIESEKVQEQAQLTQAEADIQRYSKTPSYDRKKLAGMTSKSQARPDDTTQQQYTSTSQSPISQYLSETPTDQFAPRPRFRPFPEVLHRLRWDPALNISEYVVGYLERFEGIKEMAAQNWIRDFSEEEWIPMHRVRYVKRVEKTGDAGPEVGVVWDRDGRIDLFGAGVEGKDDWAGDGHEDVMSLNGTSISGGVPL